MKSIKKLAVVGGGTAGFVSALILKTRFPDIQVDVIRSTAIGIVGVGEGSTEHWKEFMDFVGIDQYTLIKETDATYKCGIMFKDWADDDYLHSVLTPFDAKIGQYRYVYASQIAKGVPSQEMSSSRFWRSTVNAWYLNNPKESPTNQYHFNTTKLNDFLTKTAISKNINVIDDIINDVTINESGDIDSLIGDKQTYDYDFYIDSTGFKRLLIGKLGAKWESYSKYLKMKAAIAFPTPDTENYNMWTLAKAMDYGWMFRIPTYGRGGNGYIYDSDYITLDQAKQEAEQYLGHEITIGKEFKFDPGAVDKCWINNCVAIGLSASFVEPLEATSIGTSIQQSFLLMHRLINYDQKVISNYNKAINDVMENIRDFVALHYVVKKDSTDFWKNVSNMELPDSLNSKLEVWRHKLPIKEDFNSLSDYIMFTEQHHILVMHGLGLFDTDSIRQEVEALGPFVNINAQEVINNERQFVLDTKEITHKMMISVIRDTK
jgi:flavin-dependent dehydrogenase